MRIAIFGGVPIGLGLIRDLLSASPEWGNNLDCNSGDVEYLKYKRTLPKKIPANLKTKIVRHSVNRGK